MSPKSTKSGVKSLPKSTEIMSDLCLVLCGFRFLLPLRRDRNDKVMFFRLNEQCNFIGKKTLFLLLYHGKICLLYYCLVKNKWWDSSPSNRDTALRSEWRKTWFINVILNGYRLAEEVKNLNFRMIQTITFHVKFG